MSDPQQNAPQMQHCILFQQERKTHKLNYWNLVMFSCSWCNCSVQFLPLVSTSFFQAISISGFRQQQKNQPPQTSLPTTIYLLPYWTLMFRIDPFIGFGQSSLAPKAHQRMFHQFWCFTNMSHLLTYFFPWQICKDL